MVYRPVSPTLGRWKQDQWLKVILDHMLISKLGPETFTQNQMDSPPSSAAFLNLSTESVLINVPTCEGAMPKDSTQEQQSPPQA